MIMVLLNYNRKLQKVEKYLQIKTLFVLYVLTYPDFW
uniref:Uncharacterized protein n=1 Tax=Anguilla anguilla TaxID=7936 RepID=A0A0E9Q8J5_ANGAN